jgi:prophage tail gpP-like protein
MSAAPPADIPSLLINGTIYSGWISLEAERAIDSMVSTATLEITEQWQPTSKPWQIGRWDAATLFIGKDVWLTGYVDEIQPSYDATGHRVSVRLRSKTQDLVDCTPDIQSGQYRGYTLDAIARAICAPFKISVVVNTDASQVFADATLQRGETAFTFLERLGRLAGVLLTDDAMGRLVLTTAGVSRAAGSLTQGVNILAASARLSSEGRFSTYVVKGQRALGSTLPNWSSAGGIGDIGLGGVAAEQAAITPVATQLRATATDTSVPRYRPKITMAEGQLDDAGMQRRVNWERNYAVGRSTDATISVVGFRQPDGSLWQENQLVAVTSDYLQLDQDLLVASIRLRLADDSGRTVEMKLGPIEGYTPDPGEVKIHSKKGKKGSGGIDWSSAGGIP